MDLLKVGDHFSLYSLSPDAAAKRNFNEKGMHSFCEKYRRCIVDGDGLQMNYSQQFQTDLWNRREREG